MPRCLSTSVLIYRPLRGKKRTGAETNELRCDDLDGAGYEIWKKGLAAVGDYSSMYYNGKMVK